MKEEVTVYYCLLFYSSDGWRGEIVLRQTDGEFPFKLKSVFTLK